MPLLRFVAAKIPSCILASPQLDRNMFRNATRR